ncbi:MAG TPA: acyl-CoA dehydrogenase family protein [Baekduia sp.]|nr:acyl-CoA dehydrogenase family protein [Baekduia sp.]
MRVLGTEARRIGEEVAAAWADAVDEEARFPVETVDALRRTGLLGALVPADHGGPGATVEDVAADVVAIAEHCASSALVLAMHHIQVATIARHAAPATREALLPRIAAGDLLLANANSEVGLGGERRSSICALEPNGDGGYRLHKRASTVSFGEDADGVLATARRTPESAPNDQVMAICLPPSLRMEPTGPWNTLGLRGTRSRPCEIEAHVPPELVIGDYPDAFARTALPVSTILLNSVWLGIAEGAARRAHAAVRAAARAKRASGAPGDGAPPPAAVRLAELGVVLHQLREVLAGGAAAYERAKDSDDVATLRFSGRMDNLKLSASMLANDVVRRALAISGLPGYQNDSPFSMGRFLRDAAAAPLMVNNDRALQATAQSLLIRKDL